LLDHIKTSHTKVSIAPLLAMGDNILGAMLLFAVVFGPWAFGTTEPWSIEIMTGVGLGAWLVLGAKWLFLRAGSSELNHKGHGSGVRERRFSRLFFLLTALFLLYCLISALNARATIHGKTFSFDYHGSLSWLPHSYDAESSWHAFWMYSGIAGLFWAARSWILSGAAAERQKMGVRSGESRFENNGLLPKRLRLLLWVLSINGAILALEAIVQRLSGCNQLLWLVQPTINKDAIAQFGPYAYRSNASQYFNLVWPVTLGLWWIYEQAGRMRGLAQVRVEDKRHHFLISCALLMAICPILSTSRGGAIIMTASAVMVGIVFFLARWRSDWKAKLVFFVLLAAMIGGGVLLGWQELGPRMEAQALQEGLEGREALFTVGWRMAAAQPLFGTGPGTFSNLYPLFRRASTDGWPAQLHNDWLETFITFGWVGTSLLLLGFAALLFRWFFSGRIYGEKCFVMVIWIALGGCLIHGIYDFPLQIHSILTLVVLLCAVLSCLARRA
jgi:O-antigen ligase